MSDQNIAYKNGVHINNLYRSIRDSAAVERIPELVKQIISEGMWRQHYFEKTGEIYQFENFKEFVEDEPPNGLGIPLNNLIRLCGKDNIALEMIADIMKNPGGNPRGYTQYQSGTVDNVHGSTLKRPAGSSRATALRKLRRHAETNETIAELREQVLHNELTPNAALIQAGLKKKRISVSSDPKEAVNALIKNMSVDDLNALVIELQEHLNKQL